MATADAPRLASRTAVSTPRAVAPPALIGEVNRKPGVYTIRSLVDSGVSGVTAAWSLVVAGVIVASPGSEEERTQLVGTQTASPDLSASPSASATPTLAASVIEPAGPPGPSPAPLPLDGFVTYTRNASSGVPPFSFAYPANWFLEGGEPPQGVTGLTLILTPWDPKTAPGHGGIPSNSMKVDIYAVAYARQPDGCAARTDSSQPAELGGEAGWTTTNPLEDDPTVLASVVAADHSGFQYCVVGYFADPPDPTIFDRIIESFGFAE